MTTNSKWTLFSKSSSAEGTVNTGETPPPPYSAVATDERNVTNDYPTSNHHSSLRIGETSHLIPNERTPILVGHVSEGFNPANSPFAQQPRPSPSYQYYANAGNQSPGFISVLVDPQAYLSLLYFMVISPLYTSFGFTWTSSLALVTLPMLIILPLGLLLLWGLLITSRMLASLELIIQAIFNVGSPTSQYFRHPPIFTNCENPSIWAQFFAPLGDPISWNAFLFFILIKPLVSLVTITIMYLVIGICVPLILPIPLVLLCARGLGKWERELAVAFLAPA